MTAELNHTPDWVKNAVFYQIFPDRFAWSAHVDKPGPFEAWDAEPTIDGFKGGDLLGVADKLDYLEDLGINAIYLNPIFQSASNHRYHTYDYFHVDPILGGDEAFKVLLDAAHARNIRVVLDGVFNHASRGFFPFNHVLEVGPKSPYFDWFIIRNFPLCAYEGTPNYDCWWSLPGLPKLNTKNPQVRKFIFSVARYWLEQGIDGWRLDVPFEIDDDGFWREFREVVKTANPEAYIVGEVPSEAQRWLHGDMFDGVMNYQFTQAALGFFGGDKIDWELAYNIMGLGETPAMDAAQFAQRIQQLLDIYPKEFSSAQLNLIDSHDMPRFLSLVQNDKQRLYLAYLFTLTYPGAPSIYYGDEIGLTGKVDPLNRAAFPWNKQDWDMELHDKIRALVLLRNAIPALRTGSFTTLLAEGQLLAYLRQDGEDSVVIIINLNDKLQTIDLDIAGRIGDGTLLQDQIGDANVQVEEGKLKELSIAGKSAAIFA